MARWLSGSVPSGALIPALLAALPLASAARPGFEGIGDLPGAEFYSEAGAISTDGSTVVGHSRAAVGGLRAFVWADGVLTPLALPPGCPATASTSTTARKVSEDGRVILGSAFSPDDHGCDGEILWVSGSPGRLGNFGCLSDSEVGGTRFASRRAGTAARWTRDAATDLGALACDPFDGRSACSSASDLSADGAVVIGRSQYREQQSVQSEAFRWEAGLLLGLGRDSEQALDRANAVSADGSIVVGESSERSSAGNQSAFLWNAAHGRRSLQTLLERGYPEALEGWTLLAAYDVSADGRSVVGIGMNPDGNSEGWIARLPVDVDLDIRPGDSESAISSARPTRIPVAVLGSESFDPMSIDATTLSFGPEGAAPEAAPTPRLRDVNADGYLDLLAFFRADAAGIGANDSEACLVADGVGGERLLGCDAIRVLPD